MFLYEDIGLGVLFWMDLGWEGGIKVKNLEYFRFIFVLGISIFNIIKYIVWYIIKKDWFEFGNFGMIFIGMCLSLV